MRWETCLYQFRSKRVAPAAGPAPALLSENVFTARRYRPVHYSANIPANLPVVKGVIVSFLTARWELGAAARADHVYECRKVVVPGNVAPGSGRWPWSVLYGHIIILFYIIRPHYHKSVIKLWRPSLPFLTERYISSAMFIQYRTIFGQTVRYHRI